MMVAPNLPVSGCRLSALLQGLVTVSSAQDVEIHGVCADSRSVRPGDLFLACAGGHAHGLDYLAQVIEAGAAAVIYEPPAAGHAALLTASAVPLLPLHDLRAQLGTIAARYYQHPSRALDVIGITGTNGKTSCSQFIAQALDQQDARCGVIGTLGYGLSGALNAGERTTPDAVAVQQLLADMLEHGARHVVMEVSSHALEQGRVNGVDFQVAVWTNLSRDHLDYHGDMASYAKAKQRLFQAPGLRHAVINLDDDFGRELIATVPAGVRVIGYTLDTQASQHTVLEAQHIVSGADLQLSDAGIELQVKSAWGEGCLNAGLLGRFNASNLLAALATLLVLDVPFATALARLGRVSTVPGRMERFGGGRWPLVVVDYAHTPDALEQALLALRDHCHGKLWCIFGCGGERDTGKRPLMGAVAERYADRVVVTDDNPRGEDPIQIIADIMNGLCDPDAAYLRRDRNQAIAFAIEQSHPGDVILVAGKGHEDYQLVGTRRIPYSDRHSVALLLRGEG
jgi:UDP-N-acetylmuramoyl-L-alanyl-D-glutamate--2,6-diaminopimelate ligase